MLLRRRTDSDVLVNILNELQHLKSIVINVGPLFAPEHLEELVEKPRNNLETLALRFNPYVDKASYTIFLKGLYFDTGILRLARWPITTAFRHLSLIQDPIPSHRDLVAAAIESNSTVPKQAHAQPIVFFQLSCLSILAMAPVASQISHVRLRVPGRSLLTALTNASTSSTTIPATHSAVLPKPFPALEHLDISTTYVACDGAFQALLKRHASLTHLVVDRTGLIRFGQSEEAVRLLGSVVSSVGNARASEAMKVYRAAARSLLARKNAEKAAREEALAQAQGAATGSTGPRTELQQLIARDIATSARRGRSSYATERRVRTNLSTSTVDGAADAFANMSLSTTHFRPVILPAAPVLVSLACGVSDHPDLDDALRVEWEYEFQQGWKEGLRKVCATIREKLEEYARFEVRARNATHKTPVEDRAIPKLYRFRTAAERKSRTKLAASLGITVDDMDIDEDGEKDIMSTLDLVECSIADAKLLEATINEAVCTLCTLPDCPKAGRIAFTDAGDKERNEASQWRKPASAHKSGCAHLIGRAKWEEQSQ